MNGEMRPRRGRLRRRSQRQAEVRLAARRRELSALEIAAHRHRLTLRNLDLGRWTLVHASPDDVREIAAALGVRYRANPDATINHSAVVALLERGGTIEARVEGVGSDASGVVSRLTAPANDEGRE